MSIELITGKAGTPHISSNDFRAFNRANFGAGRYIMKDADNMMVVVSAATGTISISAGSCLWSGMHIRCAEPTTLSYVVPTSNQVIRVYLHYIKNAETLIESVEFVVSIGSELSPVIDNLEDATLEAYTLFYSFTASATSIIEGDYSFSLAKSHTEMETLVDNAHAEVVLFEGSAALNSTINLSESFRNFYELEFVTGSADTVYPDVSRRILTSQIPPENNILDIAMVGSAKWSNTEGMFLRLSLARFQVRSDSQLQYTNAEHIYIGSAISLGDPYPIRKIIGIGRKA